jgi:hypothetical protein
LFDERNLRKSNDGAPSHSLSLLRKYEFAEGILKKLATEADVSIVMSN